MIAIETKVLHPTNAHGTRLVASVPGGTVRRHVIQWDHELSDRDNHAAVAMALKRKWLTMMPDSDIWVAGETERGYVFVNIKGDQFTGYAGHLK